MAIERTPEGSRDIETVEFKWRRNHLFDMEATVALYEQCVDEPMATVTSVETKPTTKWYVSSFIFESSSHELNSQETITSYNRRIAAIGFEAPAYDPEEDPRCTFEVCTRSLFGNRY